MTTRRSRHLPNPGVSWLAVACIIAGSRSVPAQPPNPTEYQVKAAYLSNFGRFVEWPARAPLAEDQPFNVCVLGEDPFGPSLDAAVARETIHKAPLAAKRISATPSTITQEAAGCHIIFISGSEEMKLKSILAALGNTAALTVSDIPQFAKRGGMIELVLVGKRVRFEINLAAAERAGLTLSSELLKLATAVRKAP
jgi:hypothetical protein